MLNVAIAAPGGASARSEPPETEGHGPGGAGRGAINRLPTLQRNALRKLFDRPDISPEEVAGLGYRRLQQAEGVGQKGLETILAWLRDYGFELTPPAARTPPAKEAGPPSRRSLEGAMRLLRIHGYAVHRVDDGADSE